MAKNTMPTMARMQANAKMYHAAARAKGFYEGDDAINPNEDLRRFYIRQSLLILGEASELYEAMRAGRIKASGEVTRTDATFIADYKELVKGTAEEELADIVIRCYDCAGAANVFEDAADYENDGVVDFLYSGNDKAMHKLCTYCIELGQSDWVSAYDAIISIIAATYRIANELDIDIEKAIADKAAYNAQRPYKHGKKF